MLCLFLEMEYWALGDKSNLFLFLNLKTQAELNIYIILLAV